MREDNLPTTYQQLTNETINNCFSKTPATSQRKEIYVQEIYNLPTTTYKGLNNGTINNCFRKTPVTSRREEIYMQQAKYSNPTEISTQFDTWNNDPGFQKT